jgi:glycosyltransferase involved in cell wall biosynthesis
VRLVFLTQVVDADHPALAQTIDMVRALAARCERVTVLCDRVGRQDLPSSVELRTFGARTRVGRGARFEHALAPELLGRRAPDAVLSHMIPVFLVLAAPLAKARRVPLLLWYTHWHASRSLRLATRLADAVLSVDRQSFPLDSAKVVATGHAIDVAAFAPRTATPQAGPLRLLAIGRMARWKGYETLLEGVRLAGERGLDLSVELRGPELTVDERRHRAELEATVAATPALRGRVTFAPPVARAPQAALLAAADALVSPTQPDGRVTRDKVVYEAGACAVPVLASNDALAGYLDGLPLRLRFPPRDAVALADLLVAFGAAPPGVREETGRQLRRRVEQGHSVESWADQVVALVARLRGASRAGAVQPRT